MSTRAVVAADHVAAAMRAQQRLETQHSQSQSAAEKPVPMDVSDEGQSQAAFASILDADRTRKEQLLSGAVHREENKDDTPKPESQALNIYENQVDRKEFNWERCKVIYHSLAGPVKARIDHFIWLAAMRPEKDGFSPAKLIDTRNDEDFHKGVVMMSIAARRLEVFSSKLNTLPLLSIRRKDWDSLVYGPFKEAGLEAQRCLRDATTVMRGGVCADGKTDISKSLSYEEVGMFKFDQPVRDAAERLGKYKLMLLPTDNDREAIANFVEQWFGPGLLTKGLLLARYNALCQASPEAGKLLATAVGNRFQVRDGDAYIRNADREEDIAAICQCAVLISAHENAKPV